MTAKIPLQVVELRQPRCGLRYGVGACPGGGARPCYNTWSTCPTAATKAVYADTGRTRWRFVANRPGLRAFGEFGAADDLATNGIPVSGLSISTSRAQMNVAGVLEGKSPFGVHATCAVSMQDFVWADPVGDYYLGSRVALPVRTFWATFMARNRLFAGMELVIYDGYEGDTLAAMRQRLYLVEGIDGPSGGQVTIRGIDPLMLADGKRALFPPAYDMRLTAAISATDVAATVLTDAEANVSGILGLTTGRHVLIGSEVIGYSGYTVVEPGLYTLTGLVRGMAGTAAAAASIDARVGRVGHFEDQRLTDSGKYLLAERTAVGAARINDAVWDDEAEYLDTFRSTAWVTKPTPVVDLMGELCQQGMFNVWWDEYGQLVKMQAVRPPRGVPPVLDDATAILADSAALSMDPDARLTRVLCYHSPLDATKTEAANYRMVTGIIEGDGERPEAGGEPRTLEIFARWVENDSHARQLTSRIILRYRDVPRFLQIKVSDKDRTLTVGDVVDVTTREVVDDEGRVLSQRWQITSWAEIVPGETYLLDMQTFELVGRFGNWMGSGAIDYATATDDEKASGGFWADAAGLMPDGSAGYQWQ